MGILLPLFKSMRIIWAISKGLKMTNITLVDSKKDLPKSIIITLFWHSLFDVS